jgi:chitodextrinase
MESHAKRLRKLEVKNSPKPINDTEAPSVPAGLAAVAMSYHQVQLSWLASTDNIAVAGYTIYKDGLAIGSTGSLMYNDYAVSGGTTYEYTVDAFDFGDNHSDFSTSVLVTTPGSSDIDAPTTPTNLAASNITYNSASLTWSASTDNVGVAGYTLYMNGQSIALPTTESYEVSNLTPSSAYTFSVDAFDAAGNHSGQSTATVVNTPAVPSAGYWYVSTTGSATNTGAIDSPWSMDHALNGAAGGAILPGHTVYFRGGTYPITAAQIVTGLAGSSGARISIRPYPNDGKVTIRNNAGGTVNTFELRTISYVDIYDFDFFSTGYSRAVEIPSGVGVYHIYENYGFTQSNIRFRGCLFQNCAGKAIGTFLSSNAMEYNGCTFLQNGSSKTVDCTIWAQSAIGKTKKFKDCFIGQSSSDAIRVYSTDFNKIDGITIDGCIVSGAGELYDTLANGFYCVGIEQKVQNLTFTNNIHNNCWLTVGANIGSWRLGNTL